MWFALGLAVNTVLLWWIGVPLALQAVTLLAIALCTALGLVVVGRRDALLEDRGLALIVAASVGVACYTFVRIALLHLGDRDVAAWGNHGFFVVASLLAAWRWRPIVATVRDAKPCGGAAPIALGFAIVVAFGAYYGFANNYDLRDAFGRRGEKWSEREQSTVRPAYLAPLLGSRLFVNWGSFADKRTHVVQNGLQLHDDGLSDLELNHHGSATLLVSLAELDGDFGLPDLIGVFKQVGLLCWFGLFYVMGVVARRVLGASEAASWFVIASMPWFNSINYPPWATSYSSSRGLFGSSCVGMYHNSTQLMSSLFGVTGVALLLIAWRHGARLAALGGCLVAVSFLFKPALFTVVAPAAFLVSLPLFRRLPRDQWLALGALACVPVGWVLYQKLLGVPTRSLDVEIAPLHMTKEGAEVRFGAALAGNVPGSTLLIFALSYGIAIPVGIHAFRQRARRTYAGFAEWLSERRVGLFFVLALLAGLVPAALLVEANERRDHGNFMWGAHLGWMLILPLVLTTLWRMRPGPLKVAGLVLWAAHMWGGLLHFWLFIVKAQRGF